MRRIIIFLLISVCFTNAFYAQNGSGTAVKLVDYINAVEQRSNYRFYFKEAWINELSMEPTQTETFDAKAFTEQLKANKLNIYIDKNAIYIYPGEPIVTQLPDYQTPKTKQAKDSLEQAEQLTKAEQNYLENNPAIASKNLEVGNRKKMVDGKACSVKGTIVDRETGETGIGASVYIRELGVGALSDFDGRFELSLKPGKYKVEANYMSMKPLEFYLHVYSDGSVKLYMEKATIEMGEVVVMGDRTDNVTGMQMGFEKVTSKSIKEIPVVMGERDILKVAQLLPGVGNVGEGTSGFNVRGSSADQNMFYLNDIPVYNTAHLFGFFSSFNPDIVKDFSLYKSNIPARYGGRLASIFDIATKQGDMKEFGAQGGISPVSARIAIDGPIVKEQTSFALSWRSSYSDWILNRVKSESVRGANAFFYDASLGINHKINNKNSVKAFVYRSGDEFSLSGQNSYGYSNLGASTSWSHVVNSALSGKATFAYANYAFENTDETNISEGYSQSYAIDHYELKADFLYSLNKHQIEFGVNGALYHVDRGSILPYGAESIKTPVHLGKERGLETSLYIQDEFALTKRLTVLAGLRYSSFAELGPQTVNEYFGSSTKDINSIKTTNEYGSGKLIRFYHGPEYRLALNYRSGPNSSIKTSYNRTRQYVFMLSNTIAVSPSDQWKLVGEHIRPPVADQFSLGYYKDFPLKGLEASLEVYHKLIDGIIEYKDGADFISTDPIETQILQGDMNTDGVEFMLRKKTGKFTGWLSYTYSRSFALVNDQLAENRINHGNRYPSNFDRPHSFNYVSNYHVSRRLSFSTNLVYTTGRPVTYPVSVYYMEGQKLVQFSERNKYRLPEYIRMDVSVNIEGNLKNKKLAHSYWMINVYNLLGRRNAYSVFYKSEGAGLQAYKMAIFGQPILTVSWHWKLGNFLSK